MLEEAGRAPLLFPLSPLVVPEGPALLLVLLGDPAPERTLLELPGLLVLAGGAKRGKNRLRELRTNHGKTHFRKA